MTAGGGGAGAGMQDEANRLIREWLDPKRAPTEAELKLVLDHVAKAPFSSRLVPVDRDIRGKDFQGLVLGASEPSIVAHLAKRVLAEEQWARDVTADEYVAHLHNVAGDPDLQVAVYVGKDRRLCLGLFAPNRIPRSRLGPRAEPFIWALYLADYGTMASGYQVSGIESITLPEDVRWL